MSEQQGTELRPTLLGCLVEWCEGPLIGGVNTCVVLDQQRRNVHMLQGGESGYTVIVATETGSELKFYLDSDLVSKLSI